MRIVILGNSGSGKSTLARRLGTDLGIPYFHMDRLHWKPRWQTSSDEELAAKLAPIVAGADWVIDGNYKGTLELRLARAQVAILLEVPVWVSLLRVGRRWLMYMGRTRPDMGEGCHEKWTFDREFFKWIITWPQRRHHTYARLAAHPHLRVIVLSGRWKYADLLAQLRSAELTAAVAPSAAAPPQLDQA